MADFMREGGEFERHARDAFRQMEEGAPHPRIDEIGGFVRGELSQQRREGVAAHLSQCDSCRDRAREFEEFLADCEHPPAFPNEVIEEEFRKLERRIRPRKLIVMPPRWLAVAAGVVLAIGLAAAGYFVLAPSTPKLLAEAYQQRRNSELRIAGAGWAEFRQQRAGGSTFNLPESLLKAEARLGGPERDDPAFLRLRGEAQMIAGDAKEAVATLERARDLRPNDPQILAALGAAYALHTDYTAALDELERSLRLRAGDLETMFNRAVVLEKLMLYDQAASEWRNYLKADRGSAWAKEAQARLAAIEERMRAREKKLGQVRDNPREFMALAQAGDEDAEAWLLSAIPPRWLARSDTDADAREAVRTLGGILANKHGDTWLLEMTQGPCTGAESRGALNELMAADVKANSGDYDGALAAEETVASRFAGAGCVPGTLRARQSQLLALLNSLRTKECLAFAQRLSEQADGYSYIRLRARVAWYYATCAGRLGQLDKTDVILRSALRLSRDAGYLATVLDLWNMHLDMTSRSGLPSQILAESGEAIRIFWDGAYNRGLVYPALWQMRVRAVRARHSGAALWFARAAVWATSGPDGLPIWQVGSYGDVAAAEEEMGEWDAARTHLENSNHIGAKLPAFGVATAVALARLETARGKAHEALARLQPMQEAADKLPWPPRIGYYTAMGEALARTGSQDAAMAVFRKSIDAGAENLVSLKSESERGGVRNVIESAVRGLVATQLRAPGNEVAALRTWQSYRNLDAPRGYRPGPTIAGPVLWFLELPDGIVSWFSRGERVVFHRWDTPSATVAVLVARFLRECSDPLRPAEDLRADSRALYRWMVEPFRAEIESGSASESLVFELDGDLAGLPVQALMSPDGQYLNERFPLLIATGRASAPRPLSAASARVVVVADPAIGGASASRFPPLSDSVREAEAIQATFANTVILAGRNALLDSLLLEARNADIIHFAGHGYSESGNGAILFAAKDPSAADYQPLRAIDMNGMDWSRCALAVLSACATAEGERHGAHNPEGLVRAITKAGVARVAASLWDIDSAASAELMALFYTGLKARKGPEEALAAAQRAIRRNPRWGHPSYWAGFQLYGTI